MAQWIVIRLHPDKPAAGGDFTTYLQGLSITAFDLSTADTRVGAKLGTASYVAPPNPAQSWIPDSTSRFVQHFTIPPIPLLDPAPESVATAVIEITSLPAGYKEYPSTTPDRPDLRLEITRGGTKIPQQDVYYDVVVQPSPVPTSATFPTLPSEDVAVYLGLPAPAAGGLLDLAPDGRPPNYKALTDAVNAVLAAD